MNFAMAITVIMSVWKEALPHETLVRFSAPHQQKLFSQFIHTSHAVCVCVCVCAFV